MARCRVSLLVVFLALSGPAGPARADGEEAQHFGTAHATVVHYTDPQGQWLVLCQARADTNGDGKVRSFADTHHGTVAGDEVEPYLLLGPGPGQRIDDHVTHDRSGRWLVVVRDGRLVLVDARARKEWDLSANGASTEDASPRFGAHTAASIGAAGRRLVYVRESEKGVRVIVRDLASHDEVEIDPGTGLFHRAWIEPSGQWVHVRVVTEDTNGNGTLDRPTIASTLAPRRCRGDVGAYSTFGRDGDDDVARIAPASGGVAVAVEGLVAPIGASLLRRDDKGALVLREPDGSEHIVASGSREATLVARAARSDAFVLAMKEEGGSVRRHWLHLDGGRVHVLPGGRRIQEHEQLVLHGRRWPCRSSTRGADIADLLHGTVLRVPGHTIHVHGDRALLRRASGLVVLDLVSGEAWPVEGPFEPPPYWRPPIGSPAIAYGGRMLHLADPARSGDYEGEALAVAHDGRVLVGAGRRSGLVIGPLRWVQPTPR